MARIVYLLRHCETSWNREGRWQGRTDIELHDDGRIQAAGIPERLQAHGIVRVHTSDLKRARETAEIVAGGLGLGSVLLDPDLRERCFGVFEGLTRAECEIKLGDVWRRYVADRRCIPPGAEPEEHVVRRVRRAVERAVGALGDGPGSVLLVSHGSAIRCLLASLLGGPPPPIANGEVVRLTISGEQVQVQTDASE